jgi:hypothetical protein
MQVLERHRKVDLHASRFGREQRCVEATVVLRQVIIRATIFPTVTTIDERSDHDYQPSCKIQPWPPCS